MNIFVAAETASVKNFGELAKWGNAFTLERCTPDSLLDFLDVHDVPRLVIRSAMMPAQFMRELMMCPEGGDIVIENVNLISPDCAVLLRDLIMGGLMMERPKFRYVFIGNSGNELMPTQAEVMMMCTPIDLPLFVQRETLQHGIMSINVYPELLKDPASVLESMLSETPEFPTLKDNKVDMEDAEKQEAIKAGCTWNHGKDGSPTCAIWKAKVNGKIWYGSNTHRCYQAHSTLKAAIKSWHDVVEPSA